LKTQTKIYSEETVILRHARVHARTHHAHTHTHTHTHTHRETLLIVREADSYGGPLFGSAATAASPAACSSSARVSASAVM